MQVYLFILYIYIYINIYIGVVRLINMIVIMLFIAHLSSCFWYFIAKLDNFGPDCNPNYLYE